MSETSEIPINHHAEKPSIPDRVRAVLYTLHANPTIKADLLMTTAGIVEGGAYNQLVKNDGPLRMVDEQIASKLFPHGATPVVIGLLGTTLGLFGRAAVQENRTNETQVPTSFYNNTMIPHLVRSWQTGILQLSEATLNPEERKPYKEQVTRYAEKVQRRYRGR